MARLLAVVRSLGSFKVKSPFLRNPFPRDLFVGWFLCFQEQQHHCLCGSESGGGSGSQKQGL